MRILCACVVLMRQHLCEYVRASFSDALEFINSRPGLDVLLVLYTWLMAPLPTTKDVRPAPAPSPGREIMSSMPQESMLPRLAAP